MIFYLLKDYQDQNLQIYLRHQNNSMCDFSY